MPARVLAFSRDENGLEFIDSYDSTKEAVAVLGARYPSSDLNFKSEGAVLYSRHFEIHQFPEQLDIKNTYTVRFVVVNGENEELAGGEASAKGDNLAEVIGFLSQELERKWTTVVQNAAIAGS